MILWLEYTLKPLPKYGGRQLEFENRLYQQVEIRMLLLLCLLSVNNDKFSPLVFMWVILGSSYIMSVYYRVFTHNLEMIMVL